MALDEEEVYRRVSGYEESDVTDPLYAFGALLIGANRERTQTLETKAMTVAGYALAVLAFLVSREPNDSVFGPPWPSWVQVASIFAALALGFAGMALLVRRYPWLSDDQWFNNDDGLLETADGVKRSHVVAMHSVNQRIGAANDRKANFVQWGQWSLVGAGICLMLWTLFR